MEQIDFEVLRRALEQPHAQSREILFGGLAASKAGWRARAAEGLLALHAGESTENKTLARAFGESVDAIFSPAMETLRARVGAPATEAWTAFASSTQLTHESWHDGVGFNLDALSRMPPLEQNIIRQWLHSTLSNEQRDVDWRALDAAAALGETDLLATLETHPASDVRLRVKELLAKPEAVAEELCRTFSSGHSEAAVLRALDLVPSHPTPEVRSALIARVSRIDGTFINSAMVLLEVFGGVKDAWAERPFLFRVQEQGRDGGLLKKLLGRL